MVSWWLVGGGWQMVGRWWVGGGYVVGRWLADGW